MIAQYVSYQAIFKLIQAEQKLHRRIKTHTDNQNNTIPFPTIKQNDFETVPCSNKRIHNHHNIS